jgi:hypothetical protein
VTQRSCTTGPTENLTVALELFLLVFIKHAYNNIIILEAGLSGLSLLVRGGNGS